MGSSTRSPITITEDDASQLVLLGAGGHAREILDLLEDLRGPAMARRTLSLFAETGHTSEEALALVRDRGYRFVDDLSTLAGVGFIAAVGDPALRRLLVAMAEDAGMQAVSVVSPRARVLDVMAGSGEGLVAFADTYISSNVRIGRHCHVNQACRISHDVVLGDYATLGPGCLLTGRVRVGSSVLLGAGAILIPGVSIGDGAIVGAGSVVIRDVPAGTTVVGNPARPVSPRRRSAV